MSVDKKLIAAKVTALARHIARVEAKKPASLQQLQSDLDCQDIISHNLEKAVQLCIDIATYLCAENGRPVETSGEAFTALADLKLIEPELAAKLVRAVGFRNICVHEYAQIDWSIVMKIVESGLQDLKDFGKWASTLVVE